MEELTVSNNFLNGLRYTQMEEGINPEITH